VLGGFPHFGAGCAPADFASGGTTIRAEPCRDVLDIAFPEEEARC
jgi:hypothetical protein